MTYTRNYYPQFDFLFTQCLGILDDQSLLIHLMSMSNETKGSSAIRELVDVRFMRNSDGVTANGLIHCAKVFRQLLSRLSISSAVLIDSAEARKPTEIYLQLFESPNLTTKVFEADIDESIAWLGYDQDDTKRIKRFVARHTNPV